MAQVDLDIFTITLSVGIFWLVIGLILAYIARTEKKVKARLSNYERGFEGKNE